MAKINGARKGNAKKDLANNSAQKANLTLVDQTSKSEESTSDEKKSAKKSKKKQKQGENFSVKLLKKPKAAHSAFQSEYLYPPTTAKLGKKEGSLLLL